MPGITANVLSGFGSFSKNRVRSSKLAMPGGLAAGDAVDVAIRPENIRLRAANGAADAAKISDHVFLGNISEYYATLASGQVLRVQTHPLEQFAVGDAVALDVDATQCSIFRRSSDTFPQ